MSGGEKGYRAGNSYLIRIVCSQNFSCFRRSHNINSACVAVRHNSQSLARWLSMLCQCQISCVTLQSTHGNLYTFLLKLLASLAHYKCIMCYIKWLTYIF